MVGLYQIQSELEQGQGEKVSQVGGGEQSKGMGQAKDVRLKLRPDIKYDNVLVIRIYAGSEF